MSKIRKNSAAFKCAAPIDEKNRLNSVLMILMEIDKRIGHQHIKSKNKSKKTKTTKIVHDQLQGWSYFFYFWLLWSYFFGQKSYILKAAVMIHSMKIQITKECAAYDRYYRFNIATRHVSYQ